MIDALTEYDFKLHYWKEKNKNADYYVQYLTKIFLDICNLPPNLSALTKPIYHYRVNIVSYLFKLKK